MWIVRILDKYVYLIYITYEQLHTFLIWYNVSVKEKTPD